MKKSESSDTTRTDTIVSKDEEYLLTDKDNPYQGEIILNVSGRKHIAPIPRLETNLEFQEGTIVVRVTVNEKGEVVEATSTAGTNVYDPAIEKEVVEHAKKIKFTEGDREIIGEITYKLTVQ